MGSDVTLVNPAYETALELKSLLEQGNMACEPGSAAGDPDKYRFYVSDLADKFTTFATSILPKQVKGTQKIDIEKY